MESITNLIRIESKPNLKMSPEGDFFRVWAEFTKPIHNLAKREMDILAAFLKERYELSKVIIDSDVVDRVLMESSTKRRIREKCGVNIKHFQVIIGKFRKNGVIVNDKIYPNLIPQMTKDGVGLMIYFSFNNEQHIKLSSQESVKKPER